MAVELAGIGWRLDVVVCFPFLWCWFRFSDVSSPPLGAGGWGPGLSLRVVASEGQSEAGPVLFGPAPTSLTLPFPVPQPDWPLAHFCDLYSSLGPPWGS